MTSTKHTPGLWIIEYQEGDKPYIVADQGKRWNNPVICDLYSDVTTEDSVTIWPWLEAHENAEANARRIVACVNACNGFSIEEIDGADLFKDSIESCNLIDELQAQSDEMLSYLKKLQAISHEMTIYMTTCSNASMLLLTR